MTTQKENTANKGHKLIFMNRFIFDYKKTNFTKTFSFLEAKQVTKE